jgi:hypothetical protein
MMKQLQMQIKQKLQEPTPEQVENQKKAMNKPPQSAMKSLRNTFTQLMNSSARKNAYQEIP